MFENEVDSDDDYGGYFLKPVNEYNIVDKIKEANKELFSTPEPPSPSGQQRKVTFRAVLEDYEPQEQYAEEIEVISIKSIEECVISSQQPNDSALMQDSTENLSVTKIEEESENEIEEICMDVVDLDIEHPAANSSGEVQEITAEKDIGEQVQLESAERQNSLDDSTKTSDDDLSVIVASYIPDDPKNKFNEDDAEKTKQKAQRKRTFSFRVKKKVKEECEDITKLKMNYKTCCEYKNATQEPLPKYTGYLSTYGLSKEQWERREKLLDKKKKTVIEKNIRATEDETKKMQDNERAFTNWLKNKMRFPINKTRNMFDFKQKKQKGLAK